MQHGVCMPPYVLSKSLRVVACVRLSFLLKAKGFPIAGTDVFFTHSSVDRYVCFSFIVNTALSIDSIFSSLGL